MKTVRNILPNGMKLTITEKANPLIVKWFSQKVDEIWNKSKAAK